MSLHIQIFPYKYNLIANMSKTSDSVNFNDLIQNKLSSPSQISEIYHEPFYTVMSLEPDK